MRRAHRASAWILALLAVGGVRGTGASSSAGAADEPAPSPDPASSAARVEARSGQLLAVGTVHGQRMIIHLTRIDDNAPVGNAQVALVLRGSSHPAVALADGGYSVETPDLALPGTAAIRFEVTVDGARQDLNGTLKLAGSSGSSDNDRGSSRQIGWWILNFAVCIGFLWLWSRRKRRDPDEAAR